MVSTIMMNKKKVEMNSANTKKTIERLIIEIIQLRKKIRIKFQLVDNKKLMIDLKMIFFI